MEGTNGDGGHPANGDAFAVAPPVTARPAEPPAALELSAANGLDPQSHGTTKTGSASVVAPVAQPAPSQPAQPTLLRSAADLVIDSLRAENASLRREMDNLRASMTRNVVFPVALEDLDVTKRAVVEAFLTGFLASIPTKLPQPGAPALSAPLSQEPLYGQSGLVASGVPASLGGQSSQGIPALTLNGSAVPPPIDTSAATVLGKHPRSAPSGDVEMTAEEMEALGPDSKRAAKISISASVSSMSSTEAARFALQHIKQIFSSGMGAAAFNNATEHEEFKRTGILPFAAPVRWGTMCAMTSSSHNRYKRIMSITGAKAWLAQACRDFGAEEGVEIVGPWKNIEHLRIKGVRTGELPESLQNETPKKGPKTLEQIMATQREVEKLFEEAEEEPPIERRSSTADRSSAPAGANPGAPEAATQRGLGLSGL